MTTALIGVVSALLGTALGGLLTYFTNRDLKLKEWHLSVLRDEMNDRKKLYSELLSEATRLTLISAQTKIGDIKEFQHMGDLVAKTELVASAEVIREAKTIMDHMLSLHAKQQKSQESSFFELKTRFIAAVKDELEEMKNN